MFNKNSRGRFRTFAWSFLAGAVCGASVALLYAPMTGRKMQRKVSDATGKVKNIVEDSVDNVQTILRKVANA